MDAIQREDAPEEVRGQPLAAGHKTLVLDPHEKVVNVYQRGSCRSRLGRNDLVKRVNPGADNDDLRGTQHNVPGQWSKRRVCEPGQNQ